MQIRLIAGDEKKGNILLFPIHIHTLCEDGIEALFMTMHTMESEYDMFKLMD